MNVTGEYGLRKQIEKWVPGFYPLRCGYTTGACATAASKAALLGLLGRDIPSLIPIRFPNGETLSLPVIDVQWGEESVSAIVVKDAGDDPDVTHGHRIVSTIRFSSHPGIHFLQGEGVGKVTLPGLGLEIGEPAINKVPRQMMEQELSALYQGGLDVTISVPDGRELAKRTFNPKLGIVDGISIIGTSGIVRPLSSEAFVEAIRREIEVAQALGCTHLVINSGAKSERYLKIEFPDLLPQAFVHFGNFIGETLRIADELHIPEVTMGIMIGKAVKLAEGFLDTHSKKVVMNKAFLKQLAIKSGCSQEALALIENLTLARELWEHLSEADASLFFTELLDNCYAHCRPLMSDGKLTILLIDEEGHIFNWKER
jgi:cobalt-precorrin-5B (C1)-methyltransferase